MRTVVVSDLHLGTAGGRDLARRADLREPLLEAVRGADRLVVLGDGVELREQPQRDVAEIARACFADLGRALGPDGELVLTAGNHDHGLVSGWIDARLLAEPSGFLGLEQRMRPEEAGPLAARLAEAAAPARVVVAYPGLWLREDVFAIHGHYSDLHTTVPTLERLAAGAMARWVVELPESGAVPDDYEAALAPLYGWMHALTQRANHATVSAGAGASARAYAVLTGAGGRRRGDALRRALLGTGYAGAVAALDALGLGPLDRSLSGPALRRGGLRGMAEVARRLGIRADHLVFGHTHRSGPWPEDDLAEWAGPGGLRLHNTGSWVYQRHFLGEAPYGSPYWPGTAIELDDTGPPRLRRLLGERGHAELTPAAVPA